MSRPASRRVNPEHLIRPLVRKLHAYTPGEQPQIKGLIKLNTNENPYPASPKVLQAISSHLDARLRLYPNPRAQALRNKLAEFHGCNPDQIIIGNGSDDLLALATRAFVEPAASTKNKSKSTVQFFNPSYSLYPVLTAIHGATPNPVALSEDFDLPSVERLKKLGKWDFKAALSLVTTPNAPSGRAYSTAGLRKLCQAQKGVIILDEAYVDFANESAIHLALKNPHVIVSRTFSKSYSLCYLRVGYFVGHPTLISALDRIRDSYNVNGLGQAAAIAALEDSSYYRSNFQRIIATRDRLSQALVSLAFKVLPSQTNFLLVRPPGPTARVWLEKLREKKILVRWWPYPEVRQYLRITIGTDQEVDTLLQAIQSLLPKPPSRKK